MPSGLLSCRFHAPLVQAFTDLFVYEEDLECQAKVEADLQVGGAHSWIAPSSYSLVRRLLRREVDWFVPASAVSYAGARLATLLPCYFTLLSRSKLLLKMQRCQNKATVGRCVRRSWSTHSRRWRSCRAP